MTPPLWTTSRASGLAALMTASLAISLGLLMALRVPALRRRMPELRAAHQALANATFALIGVHALALLLDPVLKPGLAGVVVPFAGPYRPLATALGQIAAYGILALGASFYIRRRIGAARWRNAHRWLPAFWVLALLHGLLAGTDTGTTWALAALAAPVAAAAALLVTRLITLDPELATPTPGSAPPPAARPAPHRGRLR